MPELSCGGVVVVAPVAPVVPTPVVSVWLETPGEVAFGVVAAPASGVVLGVPGVVAGVSGVVAGVPGVVLGVP